MTWPSLKRLGVLIFVIAPLCAWFLVKPVRVIAPRLVGITCPMENVCVDDISKYGEAAALYAEGSAFVASVLSPLRAPPKVIFCSTVACAENFGLGARSAVTVARFGTVIGPKAWKPYYVRHEMIHVLQGEQVGVIPLLFKPSWFVEGMAYALSDDPRTTLAEPFETDRSMFRKWFQTIGKNSVWSLGKDL
ncbi:MAG: hypothetical protein HYZ45_11355 [Burkholderiales bacterium]|nr:hypothetical protein [Burkholderiales bacterium]